MPESNPDWGGARPGSGPRLKPDLARRVSDLEAQNHDRDRLDASGQKTPKAISVMRLRMNFHMWQVSIIQKRILAPGADKLPNYERDKAELERQLKLADEAASRIVKHETPALATVKNIGRDDDFDQDLSELPDDQLAAFNRTLNPIVPDTAQGDSSPASQHGPADDGGPAAPAGEGPGGTAAAG